MNKLEIPENTLIVLCGIAGCGKTTFAANHFLSTQIVSSDACRAMVYDDENNQQITGHAFELWRFIIRKRLLLGKITVADATNLDIGDRHWLTRIAGYHHFHSAVLLFNISLETCLERNASRNRVVPEAALINQFNLLQRALRTIKDEAFDFVFILNEKQQSLVEVEIAAEKGSKFSL